jgi:hypothetical protein
VYQSITAKAGKVRSTNLPASQAGNTQSHTEIFPKNTEKYLSLKTIRNNGAITEIVQ